eukprot:7493032-Pyramimonas_sp.AAC.1
MVWMLRAILWTLRAMVWTLRTIVWTLRAIVWMLRVISGDTVRCGGAGEGRAPEVRAAGPAGGCEGRGGWGVAHA